MPDFLYICNVNRDCDMKDNKIQLETERLLLRPWKVSDATVLYKLASDAEVGTNAGWPPHSSEEESRQIITTVFDNPTTWAIVSRVSNEVIGAIGYGPSCDCNLPAKNDEPTVGYWLGKAYWNKGYCTEALQALLAHIWQHTTITSLISGHFVDNPASGRVMEKCGFRPTGETCYDVRLYQGIGRPISVLRIEKK